MDRRGLGSTSSLLSQEELQGFCRLYQLPMSIHPRLLRPGDDISACNDTVVFTQVLKSCNVRYPLPPFLFSVLRFFEVHFSQMHPLGLLRVMHFLIACRAIGGEPNMPLFRRFYRFRVDGGWFTFEKRRPQNFPSCTSKVLQSLRDWKLRFFYVNNSFLPARLPRCDMQNPIVDDVPPLRDCDVPLFRMLVENPTPAIIFPEPLLVMAGVSPLWDEPTFRPAVFEEGEEMNLLKILKKASRGMEFVAIESTVPPPPPPAMGVLLDSPTGFAEGISSPDDDEMALAVLLEKRGHVTRNEPQSQGPSMHPPLKLRLRGAVASSSEMVVASTPITTKRKETCSTTTVGGSEEDDELEEALVLRRKKGKQVVESSVVSVPDSPVRDFYETDVIVSPGGVNIPVSSACLEMPVTTVLVDSVSVAAVPVVSGSMMLPVSSITDNVVASPLISETCYEDMDTLALACLFSMSLESHRNHGLEIVKRLQHRYDVAMKFQRRIATVEDELVKALEDKKQLLRELLDVDALRAESKDLKESLHVANEKVAMFGPRVVELEYELERNLVELQERRADIKSYKTDISMLEVLVKDLKRMLEVKQTGLEKAQEDALTARVEVARLSEENQRLLREVVEVTGLNNQLAADRAWLVTQGFRLVFNRIRDSQEYVQLLGDVNSACLAVGYQNGLRAGYKYSSQGLLPEESPCYDPTAESWMTKATLTLGAAGHSLLSRLETSPDIPIVELEALTAIVDPTTPLP
ncbi:hypothetical protein E3N88_15871 [Mikania micrantha]|uniref:Transposase (putative) gypsy type domain-containing protein n=1 Tax=Mikania micrantha TaxID=192012 RepID=A0A5N6NYH3_9ASTR|nr:hypothetical protein E3N88_15871 [Mikania micrantha]